MKQYNFSIPIATKALIKIFQAMIFNYKNMNILD